MNIRRATILALTVLPFAAIPSAQAEPETLAPPFDEVNHWSDCSIGSMTPVVRIPSGSCAHASDATEAGLLDVDLSLVAEGPLPSSGSADGSANVRVYDWLAGATIVLYTVTYEVSGAHADADSDPGSLPYLSYGARADTTLGGSVTLFESDVSYESFYHELASSYRDAEEPASGTFTRRMVLASQDGSTMDGPVSLDFDLYGYASVGGSTSANAATGATVQITSLTSEIIA